MSEAERTFVMLKPDAVHRGHVGRIIKRFEDKGFKLIAMKFMWASEEHLREHYAELSERPFFEGLIKYASSGPVIPMVWEGLGVVKTVRKMMGVTDPSECDPGTIRGDLSIQVRYNVIHGSDSLDSAQREIALWFNEQELIEWSPALACWISE